MAANERNTTRPNFEENSVNKSVEMNNSGRRSHRQTYTRSQNGSQTPRASGSGSNHNLPTGRSSRMCRYYLNGTCTHGVHCKYSHGGEGRSQNNTHHSNPNRNGSMGQNSNTPVMHTSTSNSNEAAGFAAQAAAIGSADGASVHSRNIPPRFAAKNKPNLPHTVTSGALGTEQQVEREIVPIGFRRTDRKFSDLVTMVNSEVSWRAREITRPQNSNNAVSRTWPRPLSPLTDNQQGTSATTTTGTWVDAPEFVPKISVKPKSYAEVLNPNSKPSSNEQLAVSENANMPLCPYAARDGVCKMPLGNCTYLHGEICDLCGCAALHPFNEQERKAHTQSCIKQHERDMELSFAVARSKGKTCGVCFEIIVEKTSNEQRFGILPNCSHCFCLGCIRKWRQARQFENKIIRACPECRVTSDFVCPSMYWVETKEDKDKLIKSYKHALEQKACKYFKQGRGKCPFGNKCFYLHALPDGTKTDVGPPPRPQRRRNNHRHEGELDVLQQIILWDFLDDRDNHWLYSLADDLEDLVSFFSDSDESEWSEYELFLE